MIRLLQVLGRLLFMLGLVGAATELRLLAEGERDNPWVGLSLSICLMAWGFFLARLDEHRYRGDGRRIYVLGLTLSTLGLLALAGAFDRWSSAPESPTHWIGALLLLALGLAFLIQGFRALEGPQDRFRTQLEEFLSSPHENGEAERQGPRIVRDPDADAACAPLLQSLTARDASAALGLLHADLDLEGRDEQGRTPLMLAVLSGDPTLVDSLLEAGADVDARAPGSPPWEPDPEPALQEILASGEDVHLPSAFLSLRMSDIARTRSLTTALGLALEIGEERTIRRLLQAGARLDDPPELPPLHQAISLREPELIDLLIEAGADVEQYDEEGYPPLAAAARDDEADGVRLLLAAGADPAARGREDGFTAGETALEIASTFGSRDAFEALAPAYPEEESREARRILESLIETYGKKDDGFDAAAERDAFQLGAAVSSGHVVKVHRLLRAGIPPDATSQRWIGTARTPLMDAAAHGYLEVIDLLIAAGADVDRRWERRSALRLTLESCLITASRKAEVVRRLVRAGASQRGLKSQQRRAVRAALEGIEDGRGA